MFAPPKSAWASIKWVWQQPKGGSIEPLCEQAWTCIIVSLCALTLLGLFINCHFREYVCVCVCVHLCDLCDCHILVWFVQHLSIICGDLPFMLVSFELSLFSPQVYGQPMPLWWGQPVNKNFHRYRKSLPMPGTRGKVIVLKWDSCLWCQTLLSRRDGKPTGKSFKLRAWKNTTMVRNWRVTSLRHLVMIKNVASVGFQTWDWIDAASRRTSASSDSVAGST